MNQTAFGRALRKLKPKIEYSGGERGWVGDSPFILLDCARIRSLGWQPRLTIRQGVVKTIEYLVSSGHGGLRPSLPDCSVD